MPLFNFRRQSRDKSDSRSSSTAQNSSALAENVEVIRRRARHRLIGSAVLVLAGIALFPLLFESQPRPVPANIAVEIPGRGVYKPLQLPAAPATAASAAVAKPAAASPTSTVAASAINPTPSPPPPVAVAVVSAQTPEAKSSVPNRPLGQATPAQAAIKLEAKPSASKPLPPSKPAAATASSSPSSLSADGAASSESARARALLNNETPPSAAAKNPPGANAAEGTVTPSAVKTTPASADTPPAASRAVVQVGAFADAGKASEIRTRLEQAGLKSYTQTVETADGKRIRVRVGPFANRAEADKAAAKIRALDLPAAILNL